MSSKDKLIEAIWAKVPRVHCKGLCAESCGPIVMSKAEADRINEKHGPSVIPSTMFPGNYANQLHDDTLTCNFLHNDKCSIYEDRPLICRLWGAVKQMRCPHGCKPFQYLTDGKSGKLIRQLERLG